MVDYKREAAEAALTWVKPGMKLGLGTGTTADALVRLLAERVRAGLDILCVATSERTAELARAEGLPLTTLENHPELDLTLDGADEIGPALELIKGGGGALLREKIVASASHEMLVMAAASKCVPILGAFPLPIEVVPFGLASTRRHVENAAMALGLAGPVTLRSNETGGVYLTDGAHHILDAAFGEIPDPERLAAALDAIPGVVEHGLFIGLATAAVVAGPNGVEWIT
jgi:ribose 5-phosphate isomerase A